MGCQVFIVTASERQHQDRRTWALGCPRLTFLLGLPTPASDSFLNDVPLNSRNCSHNGVEPIGLRPSPIVDQGRLLSAFTLRAR